MTSVAPACRNTPPRPQTTIPNPPFHHPQQSRESSTRTSATLRLHSMELLGMKHHRFESHRSRSHPWRSHLASRHVDPVPTAPQILHEVVQLWLPALLCLPVGLRFLLSRTLVEKLGSTGSSLSSHVHLAALLPMARITQGHQFIMEMSSCSFLRPLRPDLAHFFTRFPCSTFTTHTSRGA